MKEIKKNAGLFRNEPEVSMKYVLIVENELQGRHSISDMLNREGYYVVFAHTSLNALKLLTEIRPFLILIGLDSQRPDSYAFAKILKNDEDTSDILVVAVSGDGADRRRLLGSAFDGHVMISNNSQNISSQIRKYLPVEKHNNILKK